MPQTNAVTSAAGELGGRHPNRTMKRALLFLLPVAVCISAHAQSTAQEWQAKAVTKYPELGIRGSSFNKRFVEAHIERKKANPGFFTNPQWPILQADELASVSQPPAVPSPQEQTNV